MKNISIAIDGPAGAGKSTISKIIAKKLGFVYIDTGAMYRAVALYAIRNGINSKNTDGKLEKSLDDINIDIQYTNQNQHIFLNGEDVTEKIRTPEVSIGASDVSAVPAVRLKLVDIQRDLAKRANVIMDGRDIGTYVLPDADIKIFLTASVEDRAKRRYDELSLKNVECDFESVKKDIEYRDKNDSSRAFAPLKKAEDAILIDTSGNILDKSIEILTDCINKRIQVIKK